MNAAEESETTDPKVTGPIVRALLKQPLPEGWTLKLTPGPSFDQRLELGTKPYTVRGYRMSFHARTRFALGKRTGPRGHRSWRPYTPEELAAQVDAWLANYHREEAETRAKREAEEQQNREDHAKRTEMVAALAAWAHDEVDPAEPYNVEQTLFPSKGNTGPVVLQFHAHANGTWSANVTGRGLTEDEVKALIRFANEGFQ